MTLLDLCDDVIYLIFLKLSFIDKLRLSQINSRLVHYFLDTLNIIPNYAVNQLMYQPKFGDILPRVFGTQKTFFLGPDRYIDNHASVNLLCTLLLDYYSNSTSIYLVLHDYTPESYSDEEIVLNNGYLELVVFTSEELHDYFKPLPRKYYCRKANTQSLEIISLSLLNNDIWKIINPPSDLIQSWKEICENIYTYD